MELTQTVLKQLLRTQQAEITESLVYERIARVEKNAENRAVLLRIARMEAGHAQVLERYTGCKVQPRRWPSWRFYWLARTLGVTFALKLMESHEVAGRDFYAQFVGCEDLLQIARDEEEHEQQLLGMLNEERLAYMSSVVLGLNDALVEFTGALAGFTLALNDTRMIALTGSITGIAAALSMASSEYLSTKSDADRNKHPLKASVYTGIAYLVTVAALVSPFVLLTNVLAALGVMLGAALCIIAIFNYYYAVARGESFRRRFAEMAVLSFSVAGISFAIGYALKYFTGIEA